MLVPENKVAIAAGSANVKCTINGEGASLAEGNANTVSTCVVSGSGDYTFTDFYNIAAIVAVQSISLFLSQTRNTSQSEIICANWDTLQLEHWDEDDDIDTNINVRLEIIN